MPSEFLKPEEVRHLLNVSRSWLYEAANDGRIPCIRLGGPGGPLRFERRKIEEWLANSDNGATPQRR
jgi:excisionase family DNA binding protein